MRTILILAKNFTPINQHFSKCAKKLCLQALFMMALISIILGLTNFALKTSCLMELLVAFCCE